MISGTVYPNSFYTMQIKTKNNISSMHKNNQQE